MSHRVLLRDVEVAGVRIDVELGDGLVAALGPGLRPDADVEVLDGAGGALLPGLHDHHAHLLAMAARRAGPDLDPLDDPAAVDAAIRDAAASVGPTASAWIRVGGYDEHRHGPLDRARLDALAPGSAVRVQHRTGLAWVLSSVALERLGLLGPGADRPEQGEVVRGPDGEPTGWLHRLDGWLAERVPNVELDLAGVGRALARHGITGVTDATAQLGADRAAVLEGATRSGALPQRLVLLGVDDRELVAGWAEEGPFKLLADEAAGLSPSVLAEAVVACHSGGRAVAIHAVTRAENVTAVTALAQAGAWASDRIEHGSVLPHDLDPMLAAAGVTVVVQPSLVAERGDHHLAATDADDVPLLHRHRSLLEAGVRVGVGSDAPVTSTDPWQGIAAASRRTTRAGVVVGPDEAVPPAVALGWYLADRHDPGGPARRIVVGAPADLCLVDAPLAEVLERPGSATVRATWIAGAKVHG